MSKHDLAIAMCRVSSDEQLESNSLGRQTESVKNAAKYLNVTIPSEGIWSGSVSSKSGSNYSRKDLRQMLDYCHKNKNIKYLIVDEIDRFMRSVDEMFYFEVVFREEVSVKVWYAGDPGLNSDDPFTKLRRAMEAFKAEGSNLERQIKSIKGQTALLKTGHWPFAPKPGYKRGYERSIPEIDEIRGPILKNTLLSIWSRRVTPTQALINLNRSDFMKNHSKYKMDKFRDIVTDSFYAGVVEIDKQIQVRNENGLHEPLITLEQHYELIKIMDAKKKTQSGPRKNGNPKYPLSNLVHCDKCKDKSNGRLVGFDHGNGKPNSPVYEKYRCRSCHKYRHRDDLHRQVTELFRNYHISNETQQELAHALRTVWKQQEEQTAQDANRLNRRIVSLKTSVEQQVEAVTDPGNSSIKQDILTSIEKKKAEINALEDELDALQVAANNDMNQFIQFGINFTNSLSREFLTIPPEDRMLCKQILFPADFRIDTNGRVYTPEVSIIYRVATNKKDLSEPEKSLMVRVQGL